MLGVDDFAVRRGHHYGTVLIDCDARRVVDLLPGRDTGPLTEWLLQHPAPQVICRDRASAYADAARTDAPRAVQVADRFHLRHNLAAAVERCAARHRSCLTESSGRVEGSAAQPEFSAAAEPTRAMAERRRTHHALVHELLGQGAGFRQIAQHLGWRHHTVSRYAHAATWQEMIVGQKVRPSLVDLFKPYLIQRINEGCLSAITLHCELRAQGFAGSYAIIRRFVEQYRSKPDLTSVRRSPSVRQVTSWICRRPDDLADRDARQLQTILQRCPELRTAAGRGQLQPQNAQTTDVRPSQLRSTTQASATRPMSRRSPITKSNHDAHTKAPKSRAKSIGIGRLIAGSGSFMRSGVLD
ncbi:transposase [Dactylosporangium matsuzakiense]|nr:transposase [Dactylosporangium matsuzakiense]